MPTPVSKEIIAVDVDDVVFPFVPGFVDYLAERGIDVEEEHFTTYDLSQIYDIDRSKAAELVVDFIKSQHKVTVPITGSIGALDQLSQKFEILIMTARDKQFEELTKEWFAKHFPRSVKSIHIVDAHYTAGGSPKAKAEACVQMGVDYLIEDLPYYINEAAKLGIEGVLFGDYAWNRNAELEDNVTRVKNWQEVLGYFERRG